jgi:murein DD-endopeptidase MepM/ murein hydrolase activator NlpD
MSTTTPLGAPSLTPALSAGSTNPNDRAQVQSLAQEFESMLLLQVMRQLRQALTSWGDDDGNQGDVLGGDLGPLADTLDGEIARYLAKAGGVGLSDVLTRPLSELTGQNPASAMPASSLPQMLTRPAGASIPQVWTPPALPAVDALTPPSISSASRVTGQAANMAELLVASATPAATPAASALAVATHVPAAAKTQPAGETSPVLEGREVVTSAFGWRTDPIQHSKKFHSGVDLRAAYGQNVLAAAGGRVVVAREQGDYGLTVVIAHSNGYQTRYAHLSSINVAEGDTVAADQTIGLAGRSGRATGPHLHFELLHNGERLDPTSPVQQRAFKEAMVRADSTFSNSPTRVTTITE